jgi:hypothetical protein
LNEDRDLPADADVADFDRGCFSALDLRHGSILPDLSMQVSEAAGQQVSGLAGQRVSKAASRLLLMETARRPEKLGR